MNNDKVLRASRIGYLCDHNLWYSVNGGTISAHPDCLISNENSGVILADIKTMNDRAFRSLKREGTIKSFPNISYTVYLTDPLS